MDEIEEYAEFLGMNLEEDKDLLWIAKEGLKVRSRAGHPSSSFTYCDIG